MAELRLTGKYTADVIVQAGSGAVHILQQTRSPLSNKDLVLAAAIDLLVGGYVPNQTAV